MRALRLTIALALALATAPGAAQDLGADWRALAEPGAVRVLTLDEDGATRDTKVWIVQLDGKGYLRTGDTRWHANLMRDPVAVLRSGGTDVQVRVETVGDAALRARIDAAFRAKYGWQDRVVHLFRGDDSNFLLLVAHEE